MKEKQEDEIVTELRKLNKNLNHISITLEDILLLLKYRL